MNRSDGHAYHQHGDTSVTYSFSRYGTRRSDFAENRKRVLVLGDSFTFGWLLDYEDTYVARLQAMSEKTFPTNSPAFINAASGGWGTADYLTYLEAFGDAIAPDMVVVFISIGDFVRSEERGLYGLEKDGTLTLKTIERSGWLFRLKSGLRRLALYQWALHNIHSLQLIRKVVLEMNSATVKSPNVARDKVVARKAEKNAQLEALGSKLFMRLKDWTSERQVRLLVLTNGWPGIRHTWIESMMAKIDVPFKDLRPQLADVIESKIEDYKIPGDSHPNSHGARLIADAAWPYIRGELDKLVVPDEN